MAIYALDALSLSVTMKKLHREQAANLDIIIFDRFIYDELANLNFASAWLRLYIRALLCFAPKPDLSFVLDANPEEAFARKPEYPLEFVHSNRSAYLLLAKMAGMYLIAPSSVEEIHQKILSLVLQMKDTQCRELDRAVFMPAITR